MHRYSFVYHADTLPKCTFTWTFTLDFKHLFGANTSTEKRPTFLQPALDSIKQKLKHEKHEKGYSQSIFGSQELGWERLLKQIDFKSPKLLSPYVSY